ncbi:ABC transporter family substrate-binding protein [Streptacidiphilus sp. N1-3]|uniref:ABC transporter family substrate-binding protein n=1 Tax=Streptacidiphilus alkalitolerans TaxID=3342712 RepID=A0ABV6X469_9ACTN
MSGRPRPYGTLAVVACAVLGVTLAACSGGSPGAKAADLARADRSAVVQGGTLHWAVDAVPTTFNTFQADATDDTSLIAGAVLPTLFTQDEHAVPRPDPDYLSGVEQTSANPQTVVYHLNPKAVWSDGKPLSAADFTAQWHALSGRDQAFWTARTAGYDSIASIGQGATPADVRVVFAKPYGPWKGLFAPLYPAAATSTAAAFNDGSRTRLAADAGPFTLRSAAAGTVTVVRNPRWWGAPAKLDAIDFTAVAPDARTAALRAGKLDVADLSRAVEDGGAAAEAQARAVPGVALHTASAPAYVQLTLNGGSGPLADPDLRRAVAQAVDRTQIADAVLKPLGLPVVTLGSHLVMADQQGYEDDSSALAAGAENATRHLDAAGWRLGGALAAAKGDAATSTATAQGDAVVPSGGATARGGAAGGSSGGAVPVAARSKGGRALALTLLTRTGSAQDAQVADLVTAQLGRVGIPVRIRAVSGDSFFADHVSAGDFDLALFSWPASRFPVADEAALFAKPQVGPDGAVVNGQNLSGTGTDEVDRLLAQAAAQLDPGKASKLVSEADTRIWQEAPSLPLFQRPELVAVRSTVANAGAFGFGAPRFQDLGFTRG